VAFIPGIAQSQLERLATGADAEIDSGSLIGRIAVLSAIDGVGPIAEIGMVHPVEAIDTTNAANELSCRRCGTQPDENGLRLV
jgi:hypothetical protein